MEEKEKMEIAIENLIGEGGKANVYRNDHVATKVYLKASEANVKNEMKRQQFAYESGLSVPKVYAVKRLDDELVALEMEYIDGRPLMHHDIDQVEMVEAMVKLQHGMHQIQATELPKLSDILAQKILSTNLEIEIKNELLALNQQFDDQSGRLCHGDFHILNVLYDGSKHWIIDWADATAGNPLADACRTYLLMKPEMTDLAEHYLQVLCHEMGWHSSDILKWQPVVAAARLSEKINDLSRDFLYDLVQVWYEELHNSG